MRRHIYLAVDPSNPPAASAAQGVEEVATQNTVLNAKTVLKGLVRCTDGAVMQEVEVVAAKYDLATGRVAIAKKGWYSGRSFYYE